MGVYLVDHPPRIQQYRCPRRVKPSGIIGVHTAESFPDETGPDTGAENVAAFIARRTNYGSYHLLADSDSVIQLVEFSCVAYHIGTHGFNEHTIGISAATQAAKWNQLDPDYRRAMVRNMARAAVIAARWLQRSHGITVPARRISLSQALAGQKGFLAHGDADPDRRTDPGPTFPWGQFLDDYAALMAGTDLEDDMTPDEARKLDRIYDLVELYLDAGIAGKTNAILAKLDADSPIHKAAGRVNLYLDAGVAGKTNAILAAIAALAEASNVPMDPSVLEAIQRLEAQLAITTDLLRAVADGQVTPERIIDELHERLGE